jgi:hypothetical protein
MARSAQLAGAMLIHGVETTDVMAELSALNRLNADWDN